MYSRKFRKRAMDSPAHSYKESLRATTRDPQPPHVQLTLTSIIQTFILRTPMTIVPYSDRKSFVDKILPATHCSPRIIFCFLAKPMNPIDQEAGGRGVPHPEAQILVSGTRHLPCDSRRSAHISRNPRLRPGATRDASSRGKHSRISRRRRRETRRGGPRT